ncbi:TPA: DUF3343 domain-containing protein [Klebsiella aerogenes]|uniref:DUF3343 domain-containing protein n=1 Tax=Klebsiella aerogenes TaxID=548 RepID=UPI0018C58B85|nr:DUF3343 domain-containing protein [Klebsiella aerogenes]MBG1888145.1 DUF3343 domain-containing protein [Klebsiella aerogenes]MBQ0678568.1 DUF3343 domain-containing protein [Klebsiella aerogenes]HCR0151169.1 DUF3343 domain-containing protein [Klebsiella aerogenes]HDS8022355.1 DUF3343 domain-containing protein [Klebsiella aerogenes]
MSKYLFLFHSTVGVVRMRKALQAAAMTFEVKDIPRQLRSGCGLCVLIEGSEKTARSWIIAGHTAALHRPLPAGGLIGHYKTRRREAVQYPMDQKHHGQRRHQRYRD